MKAMIPRSYFTLGLVPKTKPAPGRLATAADRATHLAELAAKAPRKRPRARKPRSGS